MARHRKTIAGVALLAVIALAGAFSLQRTPIPAHRASAPGEDAGVLGNDWSIFSEERTETADTSTWKVYEDQRLGFKTRVPGDWEVKRLPFPYEGADDFVMFMRSGDPNETIVAELGFSYYWNTPHARAIQEIVEDSRIRAVVGIAEWGYGPFDYSSEVYTFKEYRVVKHMLPVIDVEGRWEGDRMSDYNVYIENVRGEANSFTVSLFSPQIPGNTTDMIVHGVLAHLVRIK